MTDNSNNSGWITASGQNAGNGSNLLNTETRLEPQTVVGKGGLEINGTGRVQRDQAQEVKQRPNDDTGNGLMATVRTTSGGPVVGRIACGKDLILVRGMPVDLNNAANLGWVTRNADGSFSDKEAPATLKDPTAGVAKAPVGKPEGEADGDDFGLPLDAQKALGAISTTVMPGDTIKAVDSIIIHGEVAANTLARMASQAGVEPDDMAAQVATAEEGFRDVMTGIVEDAGIDTEAFGSFIEADPARADKMMQTARKMVMTNDTAGLRELTETFYEQADKFMPDETRAALTEAGFKYQEGPDGLQVLINGNPVSFAVAVKQQLVRFI